MNQTGQKILDVSVRPVVTGVMAGIASKLFLPSQTVNLFGINMPAAVLYGGVVTGASALNAANDNFILPMLPNGVHALGNAIQPVWTGVATTALFAGLNMYYGQSLNYNAAMKTFILGAGSEVLGKYAKQNFVEPFWNIKTTSDTLHEINPNQKINYVQPSTFPSFSQFI